MLFYVHDRDVQRILLEESDDTTFMVLSALWCSMRMRGDSKVRHRFNVTVRWVRTEPDTGRRLRRAKFASSVMFPDRREGADTAWMVAYVLPRLPDDYGSSDICAELGLGGTPRTWTTRELNRLTVGQHLLALDRDGEPDISDAWCDVLSDILWDDLFEVLVWIALNGCPGWGPDEREVVEKVLRKKLSGQSIIDRESVLEALSDLCPEVLTGWEPTYIVSP